MIIKERKVRRFSAWMQTMIIQAKFLNMKYMLYIKNSPLKLPQATPVPRK